MRFTGAKAKGEILSGNGNVPVTGDIAEVYIEGAAVTDVLNPPLFSWSSYKDEQRLSMM